MTELTLLLPTPHKTGHFGDILSSQSLSTVLKKLNLTQQKYTYTNKLTNKQLLGLFICVCIALCTTVAHNTVQNRSNNFPLTLQTIIIAPMMSI